MKSLKKYLKVWWLMSRNSFTSVFNQRAALVIFLSGKIIRFILFLGFLFFLVKGTKTLAGYDINEVAFFFLTFNIVDVLSQFLFREVYRFRPHIISGDFDLILVKPVNALFRVLVGGADVIDLITIPPLIAAAILIGYSLQPTFFQIVAYILLLFNSLIIAASFHIAVLALGILTLEVDNTIMIYRDFMNLGKLPVDVYKEPIRSVITYLIPVGIAMTLPAKILIGVINPSFLVIAFIFGILSIYLSLKLWKFALLRYTSASS